MDEIKFKEGDLVKHKTSDSPIMCVAKINVTDVTTRYWDRFSNDFHEVDFYLHELVPANSEEQV